MSKMKSRIVSGVFAVSIAGATLVSTPAPASQIDSHIHHMLTVEGQRILEASRGEDCVVRVIVQGNNVGCAAGLPMTYGTGGIIHTAPAVYIVRWGWTSDPSGEAAYQENFFKGVGGSAWSATQTQYCDDVSEPTESTIGGFTCTSTANHVGNPANVWKGTWVDNTNPVPASPTDANIIAEVARAAVHFGNTTPASNTNSQYIIDTPTGKSTTDFGTVWCAYHSMATSIYGNLAYTNFPYITDAGTSCGRNAVNPGSAGSLDGVSIVGGHEYEEVVTDANPNLAWSDTTGAENADKCAWLTNHPGAMKNIVLSTGTFAIQGLWSNRANNGLGACVTS